MKGRLLDPSRPQRERFQKSRRQERETSDVIGGKTHPGSGNQWHTKADVSSKKWLVEAKHTEKGSYRLTKLELNKLVVEATMQGKLPGFLIQFGTSLERFLVLPVDVAIAMGFSKEKK